MRWRQCAPASFRNALPARSGCTEALHLVTRTARGPGGRRFAGARGAKRIDISCTKRRKAGLAVARPSGMAQSRRWMGAATVSQEKRVPFRVVPLGAPSWMLPSCPCRDGVPTPHTPPNLPHGHGEPRGPADLGRAGRAGGALSRSAAKRTSCVGTAALWRQASTCPQAPHRVRATQRPRLTDSMAFSGTPSGLASVCAATD